MSNFGQGDATFQAAGGCEGIRQLVDDFYDAMQADEHYVPLAALHGSIDEVTRDKLTRFLWAWMGGPRTYSNRYGSINIPSAHAHLPITEQHRDLWLECMERALRTQPYPEELVEYLLAQLAIPAERAQIAAARRAQKQ